MASKPAKGRIRELDFVRGIAILLVMGVHFVQTEKPPFPGYEWFFSYYGPLGVDLFFVLSGFLVGGLLMAEFDSGTPKLRTFMIRRAFKIWPLYYTYLLFIVLAHRHPLNTFLLANLLHIQNYMGTSLSHTWSLAVEEHFYLALPLFLLLIWDASAPVKRIAKAAIWVAALFLLSRVFTVYQLHDPKVSFYTHTRIDSLFFGVLISAVYYFDRPRFDALASRKLPLIFLLAVGMAGKAFGSLEFQDTLGATLVYVAAGAVLLLVYAHSGTLVNQAWYKVISWIGFYSYGIFLWHNSVREPIGRALAGWHGTTGWLGREVARYAAGILLGVIVSRTVEWPFIRLRDRLFPRTTSR